MTFRKMTALLKNEFQGEPSRRWLTSPSRVKKFAIRSLVIVLIALALCLIVAEMKDPSMDVEQAVAMVMETLMPTWESLTEWNLEKHRIQLAKDRPLLQACFTVAINGFRKEPIIVQQNARLLIQCEGLIKEFRMGKGHCEISVLALNEKIQYIVKELTVEMYHARMLVREEPWSTNDLLRVKHTLETWRILSETFRKCLQLTLEMFPMEPWCVQNNAYVLVDCGGNMVKFVSGNKENYVYVYSDDEGVYYKVIPYSTWNQIARFFSGAK